MQLPSCVLLPLAQTPLLRFAVDLSDIKSYSKLYNISTCGGSAVGFQSVLFVVQLVVLHVVQQIHNKSKQVEFRPTRQCIPVVTLEAVSYACCSFRLYPNIALMTALCVVNVSYPHALITLPLQMGVDI